MTSSFGERALRTGNETRGRSEPTDASTPAAARQFTAVSGLLREQREPITSRREPRLGVLDVLRRPAPIRRVIITDEETGEDLRPLTVQDLLNGLSSPVKRRLAGLPTAMLDDLASLPEPAQRALLGLAPDTQLQIIDVLQGGMAPAGVGPGAIVATPRERKEPNPHGSARLPPDFADFLLGKVRLPQWLQGLRIVIPRPRASGQLALGAPMPRMGDLRPPFLSDEGSQGRRVAFGEQLAQRRDQPVPSASKVSPSSDLEKFGRDHVTEGKKRAEAERDDKWSSSSAVPYGEAARTAADSGYKKDLVQSQQNVKNLNPHNVRQGKKTPPMKEAEKKHSSLEQNPPDLEQVQSAAEMEWKADLLQLRQAGLHRDVIDALVVRIPMKSLHGYLATSGAVSIARVASRLNPARTASLLTACDGKLPAALTDAVADALGGLLDAGATVREILNGLKGLSNQIEALLAAPAAACVKLLRSERLPALKLMVQGGQTTNLANLAGLTSSESINLLLGSVPTATELGQLFTSGAAPVASLLSCSLSVQVLKHWCSGPMLATTVTLLARPDLPQCLPMLPALAKEQIGPDDLIPALIAGAPAPVLRQAVTYAPKLLQTATQTLAYFLANPLHTVLQYRQAKAQAVSTEAGLAPVPNGYGQAQSGARYRRFIHSATISSAQLMMLLGEDHARLSYVSTFRTVTEASGSGGDTEEYDVQTLDADGTWAHRWVIHLHRKKGDSKASVPIASHLKRYEERQLKDAQRIAVASDLAAKCREVHPR